MKTRIAMAAALAVALTATAASAELLDFSYTRPGGNGSASWTQSSNPTPTSYITGKYTEVLVTNGTESYPGQGSDNFGFVSFVNNTYLSFRGGFYTDGNIEVSDFGGQPYTGTEANPVFAPGVYSLDHGTLTVTAAPAVPEPATWAMMLAGFAGLGFLGYRRNKAATLSVDSSARF